MKPEEIKMALECCTTKGASCKDCPAYVKVDGSNCKKYFREALNLLNQYEAEQKELKYKVKKWKENYESSQVVVGDFREIINKQAEELKTAKAKAIKEFAERLKEISHPYADTQMVFEVQIDNLLKEMGVE